MCKPKKFLCSSCIFSLDCQANLSDSVKNYPVKSKKNKVEKKEMSYVIILSQNQKIFLNKRSDRGIWKNLFEFFLIESNNKPLTNELILENLSRKFTLKSNKIKFIKSVKHKLSHIELKINFYLIKVKNQKSKMYDLSSLERIPFPRPLKVVLGDIL